MFPFRPWVSLSLPSFRHFNATPVSVYNCDTVKVVGSKFLSNTAHGMTPDRLFRTYAGGIAYTSHNQSESTEHSLLITECLFINNSALQAVEHDPTQRNYKRLYWYTGRGGGIAAAVGWVENINILIEDCTFIRNMANLYGGGLYITAEHRATNHHYTITNCTFVENVARGGGGFGLTFFPSGRYDTMNQIILRNTTFLRNSVAENGGAMHLISGMLLCVGCYM